jgi:hypothetical protein
MKHRMNCVPFVHHSVTIVTNEFWMGIKQSLDIAQQIMEQLLRPYPDSEVYIDDIGVVSSWREHLESLKRVLGVLQDNNFTANPLKCEWAGERNGLAGVSHPQV